MTAKKRRQINTASASECERLQSDILDNTSSHSASLPASSKNSSLSSSEPSHDTINTNEPTMPSLSTPLSAKKKKESLNIDQLYDSERTTHKTNHWRYGPWAAGFVETSWHDERNRNAAGLKNCCCDESSTDNMDPTGGCQLFSSFICSKIGAKRIGNMAVLKEGEEIVSNADAFPEEGKEGEDDDSIGSNNGGHPRQARRKIDIIVGPYWPCLIFITYPLILTLTTITAIKAVFVPNQYIPLMLVWSGLSGGLCSALFRVGCKDPGILPRYRNIPNAKDMESGGGWAGDNWRWNDQAQTYKPKSALYDSDCAVVVEDFDHTCPWTGTAIGKKNMLAFQIFVTLIFICLPLDILLLSGIADSA